MGTDNKKCPDPGAYVQAERVNPGIQLGVVIQVRGDETRGSHKGKQGIDTKHSSGRAARHLD